MIKIFKRKYCYIVSGHRFYFTRENPESEKRAYLGALTLCQKLTELGFV